MAKKTLKIADKPTLDEVKALLENEGYGLSTLKSLISVGGETTYPNISTGRLSDVPLVVNGKGKITLYNDGANIGYISSESKVDGVNVSRIPLSYGTGTNIVLTFENSISLLAMTGSNLTCPYYILQLAN